MATDIPLLRIVADLMRDPELRQRFNRNPRVVAKEYGLEGTADDQLNVLFSMREDKIALKLMNLIQTLSMNPGEFPSPGEEFFQEDGGADPVYPSPRPGVFRIRPRRVPVAKANSKFEFVVYGQSFAKGLVQLELKRVTPNDGKKPILDPPVLLGTFRGSILRTVVSPPVSGFFAAGNEFQVIVKVNPGTALEEDVGPGMNLLLEIV